MSGQPAIYRFSSLERLVSRLRDDFRSGGQDFVLLYAYNGTGKTWLSMEFKNAGKTGTANYLTTESGDVITTESGEALEVERAQGDTLYFNAYTEDLFVWDNDLEGDSRRVLRLNSNSRFFIGIRELAVEANIQSYLGRYTDLDFDVDYGNWTISFRKGEAEHIKISRGEQNIFIWCLFMAICERVIDGHPSYDWVKYFYIDDPISSLDDNNAIAVASDLAKLLRKARERNKVVPVVTNPPESAINTERRVADPIKVVISSHHALFFNVVCNELKMPSSVKCKRYFLHRPGQGADYTLRATDDTPFFHHVAMLSQLQKAAQPDGVLYTYHFNMLRSVLEKTATFFGKKDFSACLEGVTDEGLYARALNLLSHGKYSLYEPVEMLEDNRQLFRDILAAFLNKHAFDLPELLDARPVDANADPVTSSSVAADPQAV